MPTGDGTENQPDAVNPAEGKDNPQAAADGVAPQLSDKDGPKEPKPSVAEEPKTGGEEDAKGGDNIELLPKIETGLQTENQIIVLIMPEDKYLERLMSVVKDVVSIDDKLCYVSLNRPYSSLKQIFNQLSVNVQNVHFIDAITRTAQIPPVCEECEFVSSPGALTELSVTISNSIEKYKFKHIIFDSLSTLLVYESDTTIAKFVHFLMAKVRVANSGAIFTCLKQDSGSVLVKDINMFADKVVNLDRWHVKT